LIPSFAFGYGVLNVGSRNLYSQMKNKTSLDGAFDMDIAGGDILYLSCFGLLFILMIFVCEYL
jgi:ATP-binding cassette, subfamily A (ABC1), member 3